MFKISSEQLKILANYLTKLPYEQVRPYIQMLAALEEIKDTESKGEENG